MNRQPEATQHSLETETPSVVERLHTPTAMHLGWRIVLTLVLLTLLAVVGLLLGPRLARAAADPLVLAFYYSWFDENTWTYDKLSDLPAELYVSRDRGAMGRHIEQAQRAGIDAFLVAWYGPGGEFNQTEPNLSALLDEAATRGFKIGILFETDSPYLGSVDAVIGALQHVQAVHANHPAYLRVNGRPVVFFWRPAVYDVETWRAIRAQADGAGSGLWISEGTDLSYLAVFDGHHLYSNTWNPSADLTSTNGRFAAQVAAAADAYGVNKLWVATVMPGYDDTKVRPGSGFSRVREGGAYYGQSWDAAIASRPTWIVINSFNEWPEGTFIEPSAAYGGLFLDLTATWSQQFKAGGGSGVALPASMPAALAEPAPPAEQAPQNGQATPSVPVEVTEPTAVVEVSLLNVRSGPSTDFDILAQLPAGAARRISGWRPDQPDWWQIDLDGQVGWVYAPLVAALGPMDRVPEVTDGDPASAAPMAPNEFTMTPLRDPATPGRYLGR